MFKTYKLVGAALPEGATHEQRDTHNGTNRCTFNFDRLKFGRDKSGIVNHNIDHLDNSRFIEPKDL